MRVIGLRQALARLAQFGDDIADLEEGHDAIERRVVAEASERVRVDSSALLGTIRPAGGDPGRAAVVAGSASVTYALIQDRRTNFLRGPGNDEAAHRRDIEDALEAAARRANLNP